MTYFLIDTSEDGEVSIRPFSYNELLIRLKEEELSPGDEKKVGNGIYDLSEQSGWIVIKGEVASLKKRVVEEFVFE